MNDLLERIAAVVGWDLDTEALDLELTDEEVARDLDYGREDEYEDEDLTAWPVVLH
jgi:hypothetical protein